MAKSQQGHVTGVLNKTSMTIHKRETGTEGFKTLCGQSYHLDRGQLQKIRVNEGIEERGAEKCGRCFEDGRGY